MARTRTAELLPGSIEDGETYEVTPPERPRMTDADEALYDFWETSMRAGAEAEVIIRKIVGTGNSSTQYCGRVPVDKYDYWGLQDYIRESYGPGDYRLMLSGPDPRKGGVRGLLQNQLVSIGGVKKTDAAPQGDPVTMALLERLDRMEQRLSERTDSKSPMDQMKENLQMMVMMKEVFGGQQRSALGELKELLSMKNELSELVSPGGSDDAGPGWVGPLLNALPTLLSAAMATRPAPVIVHPNPVARAARPVHDVKPEAAVTENLTTEQKAMITDYLGKAVTAAQFGAPAETVADRVIDALSEADAERVAALLQVPDLLAEAVKLVPAVASHKQWFDDLLEWLKGGLGLPSRFADAFDDAETVPTETAPETPSNA